MNIRKPIDYSNLCAAVDTLLSKTLPQTEMHYKIGRQISTYPEKGAAVAVSEYLQATYSNDYGFSPRNVRRMRDFFRTYENCPDLLLDALNLNWTQNVIILECCKTEIERCWYLKA